MSDESPPRGGVTCWTVGIVLVLLLLGAGIVVPNLIRARTGAPVAGAIGTLKMVATAEAIFREGDKEQDGNLDYGMLSELSSTQLVDAVVGSGTKYGYLFQAAYSTTTSEFLWYGTGRPTQKLIEEETVGYPIVLYVNQAGIVHYTSNVAALLSIDPGTCAVDTRATPLRPVGK